MSYCKVSEVAIQHVASLLGLVDLSDVFEVEEVDPQFESVRIVCSAGGLRGAVSALLAALAAYQLRCRGEDYWAAFARWFTENRLGDPVEVVSSFILRDACSTYLRDIKRARIARFSEHSSEVGRLIASCNFLHLWKLVSRTLDSDPYSKTAAFSVKIGYYGGRALKLCRGPLPPDIPIPVDIRIARATLRLGLVTAPSVNSLLRRCRGQVISVWRSVGDITGIPSLHIDTLLWALQTRETLYRALERVRSGQAKEVLHKLHLLITTTHS